MLKTVTKKRQDSYDPHVQLTTDKIPKASIIRIEVWDDDSSGIFSSPDDLIIQTEGGIEEFANEPVRHGSTFLGYTSSIEISLTWQDEYI